jgi:hypothetical protein
MSGTSRSQGAAMVHLRRQRSPDAARPSAWADGGLALAAAISVAVNSQSLRMRLGIVRVEAAWMAACSALISEMADSAVWHTLGGHCRCLAQRNRRMSEMAICDMPGESCASSSTLTQRAHSCICRLSGSASVCRASTSALPNQVRMCAYTARALSPSPVPSARSEDGGELDRGEESARLSTWALRDVKKRPRLSTSL